MLRRPERVDPRHAHATYVLGFVGYGGFTRLDRNQRLDVHLDIDQAEPGSPFNVHQRELPCSNESFDRSYRNTKVLGGFGFCDQESSRHRAILGRKLLTVHPRRCTTHPGAVHQHRGQLVDRRWDREPVLSQATSVTRQGQGQMRQEFAWLVTAQAARFARWRPLAVAPVIDRTDPSSGGCVKRIAPRCREPSGRGRWSLASGVRCRGHGCFSSGFLPFSEMIGTSLRPVAQRASGKPWSSGGRARPRDRLTEAAPRRSKGVAVITSRYPPARRSELRIDLRPEDPVSLDQTDHRVEPTTGRSDAVELGSRTAGGDGRAPSLWDWATAVPNLQRCGLRATQAVADCRHYLALRQLRGRSKGHRPVRPRGL